MFGKSKSNARRRRGAMLLEFTVALVVMMACCTLLAQLVFLANKQERVATSRQVAERVVANRLEQLVARSWKELPAGEPTMEPAPPELLQLIPSAELRTQIAASEDDAVRRIRVEAHWLDPVGQPVQAVGLSAWKHRPATEAQP